MPKRKTADERLTLAIAKILERDMKLAMDPAFKAQSWQISRDLLFAQNRTVLNVQLVADNYKLKRNE